MKKLFFLTFFLLASAHSLKASEALETDQEFENNLDTIKSPFEEGLPKPVVIVPVTTTPQVKLKPIIIHRPKPKPKPIAPSVIKLPEFKLQGVMVGDEMHQAIIDDQVVPIYGTIKGAKVIAVTKEGIGLIFKGKKFFLKID